MPVTVHKIELDIPQNVPVSKNELLPLIKPDDNNAYIKEPVSAEIIITGYSSGKEIFIISDSSKGKILEDSDPGSMEAIVKIRNRDKLINVLFIKVKGKTKEEIINNFGAELKKILN